MARSGRPTCVNRRIPASAVVLATSVDGGAPWAAVAGNARNVRTNVGMECQVFRPTAGRVVLAFQLDARFLTGCTLWSSTRGSRTGTLHIPVWLPLPPTLCRRDQGPYRWPRPPDTVARLRSTIRRLVSEPAYFVSIGKYFQQAKALNSRVPINAEDAEAQRRCTNFCVAVFRQFAGENTPSGTLYVCATHTRSRIRYALAALGGRTGRR